MKIFFYKFNKIIDIICIITIYILIVLLINKLIGLFISNTYIQKEYINIFFNNIERRFEKTNEYIPKNYNGNIFIILDDFKEYNLFPGGHGTTHGNLVYENFLDNINDKSNFKIIRLNRNNNTNFFIYQERIVNFVKNISKVQYITEDKLYYYDELIDYIVKENPNSNIIINNSFQNFGYNNQMIKTLNKYSNVSIVKAMPYIENNYTQYLTEFFGNVLNIDHKRLLYITLCGDYQPSFSKNVKCVNDDNTSLPTPIIGYNYFKK